MPATTAIVLEDHVFQRTTAVYMLRQLGFCSVHEAASGEEALAVLNRIGPVDILLCDLCMEGMDGIDFLRDMSLSGLVGSVVIFSSLPLDLRQTAVQIGLLQGFNILGELAKPIQLDQLKRLLSKIDSGTSRPLSYSIMEAPSEAEVRRGLLNGEFEGFYQPKLDLQTGVVAGFEVLARWRHPSRGILSPVFFLPVMEQFNLMDDLFFVLLQQGLALQNDCANHGTPIRLAFNLHPMQIARDKLISQISELLRNYRLGGSELIFELTESGILEAPATSLENLLRLRLLGCGVSIDDFGAGYSSLQRLCQLPFSEIKLDGEFVRSLERQPRFKAAIKSMQSLAESFGMTLVVEGVETLEQHELVKDLGCSQGQGYFYAKPMDRIGVLKWQGMAELK